MYGLIGKIRCTPGQRDALASLALPAVQQAIAKARPLIAGFGERFDTQPLGGVGL